MTPPKDIRDLVGDDVPPEELERLERVHELILRAGPPPELPPRLESAPDSEGEPARARVIELLPRRRRGAAVLVAAALVAVAFAVGYLVGGRSDDFHTSFVPAPMVGTPANPNAFASLRVGERDDGGNWPIRMKVRGLPELPSGSYYVLYVSKGDAPLAPCGSFRVHRGVTTVKMSAAYNRDALGWDAWVVTVEREGQSVPGKVVMVTKGSPA